MSVVLPAPFSPNTACTVPWRTNSLASLKARDRPEPLVECVPARAPAEFVSHKPVGAAMNVDGMSNVAVRCSASAVTPSVSVA